MKLSVTSLPVNISLPNVGVSGDDAGTGQRFYAPANLNTQNVDLSSVSYALQSVG